MVVGARGSRCSCQKRSGEFLLFLRCEKVPLDGNPMHLSFFGFRFRCTHPSFFAPLTADAVFPCFFFECDWTAGHVSGVTDTRFSALGDRILTASMNDGTARVYSWGPRFSHLKHLVLKVRDGSFWVFFFFQVSQVSIFL